jgi:hypothetical protein
MSKPEMKALEIDSPNLADPTMMSLIIPVLRDDMEETLTFVQPWGKS